MIELEKYILSLKCLISYEVYKNKKGREIHVPNDELKQAQKEIARILSKEPISKYATGFSIGSNIVKNAQYHNKSKLVINLDIKKFFESTNSEIIRKTLFRLGYNEFLQEKIVEWCTFEGKLATGAPTSPVISNLVLRNFDEIIGSDLSAIDVKYSRYADDITISGDKSLNPKVLIDFIKSQLPLNYTLNERKQRVYRYKKLINGLVVHENQLSLGRRKKEILRNHYYSLGRSGQKIGAKDKGYLSYIHSFNIKLEEKLKDSYNKGYKVYLEEIK